MAIYKDEARNTWYVRTRQKTADGKYKEITKRGFKTKREAKEYESSIPKTVPLPEEQPELTVKHIHTFREMDQLYLDFKQTKPSTRRQEEYRLDTYFADYVNRPIDQISKGDLASWYTELGKKDFSTSVKNFCIYAVKGVFKYANEFYDYPNPSMFMKKFKKKQEEIIDEMETWTPEEFKQFHDAVENETYRAYFSFLYWTGCRRSEGLAVCYTDFDPEADTIRIWHAIKNFPQGFIDLKNDSSIRTIKLDPVLMKEIQPFIDQCDEDHPFIFGRERSLPITSVQRQFKKAINSSGVKPIRIHDLRHSHATVLINAGVNIVAVSKRLGHSTIEQTLKTYTHLLEKTDKQMMDIMTGLHAV